MTNLADTPIIKAMTSENVGFVDDLAVDSMKMVTVEGHPVVLTRTTEGIHALDNACPHQGYGLATGSLAVGPDGKPAVTCQWHNWKFRVCDGVCTIGEEDVATHDVEVADDGAITVTVVAPTTAERQARLWPSLRRGIERDYAGQISRDALRLRDTGVADAEIMWAGVEPGMAQNEWGPGHNLAMAADCLHLAEVLPPDEGALALVQGLAGLSETGHGHQPRPLPAANPSVDFAAAMEAEDYQAAMAWTVATTAPGDVEIDLTEVRHRFIEAVASHHTSLGHGAIYTQKAFELLERVGAQRASAVLPHLAVTISGDTREDTLPYMAKTMRALAMVDVDALANADDRSTTGWQPEALANELLESSITPIEVASRAVLDGAGIEGLLDAVSLAVSQRLLRYDLAPEADAAANFGWLDITHGLTYARAARWAWQADPGPHTARLALFTAWLAHDTGRYERRAGVRPPPEPCGAVAAALSDPAEEVGERLARQALDDRAGSFIVAAHLVKTVQAARQEAATIGSPLPLAAAARFVNAPRRERFVARNVAESLDFIRSGRPPRR